MNIQQATDSVRPFMAKRQLDAIRAGTHGEEKQFFITTLLELGQTIQTMPKTYGQDGLGDQAIVHLHYFIGNCHWWITELDIKDGVSQAFGLASLGYEPELGYISITELTQNGVELDLHWTAQTVQQVMASMLSTSA